MPEDLQKLETLSYVPKSHIKTNSNKAKRKPSSNGANAGRDNKGRFGKGNNIGKGNRGNTNEKAKALKAILLKTITEEDIREIAKKLAKKAKNGDVQATKELFDRLWGRAIQEVDLGENTAKTIFDILAVCGLNGGNGD